MSQYSEFYFDEHTLEGRWEEMMPFFSLIAGVLIALSIGVLLVGIVNYVLRSLALQTIAKRRGLKNTWLSWIPVGQEWIIGSVSDQYKYLTEGKNQVRRKILLVLELAVIVVTMISGGTSLFAMAEPVLYYEPGRIMMPTIASMLISVVSLGVRLAAYVFRQMSVYDLYKSCKPANAVLFLIFGIIFPFVEPIFLMVCRNKDLGMPVAAPQPAYNPYEQNPYQPPYGMPPQPPVPEKDPWEE